MPDGVRWRRTCGTPVACGGGRVASGQRRDKREERRAGAMHGVHLISPNGAPQEPGRVAGPLLVVERLVKQFRVGDSMVTALRHVNLTVRDGEIIAIRGRSGAGKTTLLNLIAGLDDPTEGRIFLFGNDLATLSERQRTELRRTEVGFVFQAAHLVTALTARENVEVPLRLAR